MIEVWRTLKIPDSEASKVATALRIMGYPVTMLDRLEYFALDFAGEITQDFVRHANDTIVNPNKHFSMIPGYRENERQRFEMSYDARIFVQTDIDTEAVGVLSVLRERLGYGDRIQSVRRKIVWGLNLDATDDQIRRYLKELVWEPRYFFANPNFQKAEVQLNFR